MKLILLMLSLSIFLVMSMGVARLHPQVERSCQTRYLAASIGGDLRVDETIAPGSSFETAIFFLNRTDGKQYATTQVGHYADPPQFPLPSEWVTFEPSAFCVKAGKVQRVDITIAVPLDAVLSDYIGLLEFDVCKTKGAVCAAVASVALITVE